MPISGRKLASAGQIPKTCSVFHAEWPRGKVVSQAAKLQSADSEAEHPFLRQYCCIQESMCGFWSGNVSSGINIIVERKRTSDGRRSDQYDTTPENRNAGVAQTRTVNQLPPESDRPRSPLIRAAELSCTRTCKLYLKRGISIVKGAVETERDEHNHSWWGPVLALLSSSNMTSSLKSVRIGSRMPSQIVP